MKVGQEIQDWLTNLNWQVANKKLERKERCSAGTIFWNPRNKEKDLEWRENTGSAFHMLFFEKGIVITSILTVIRMAIFTLVLDLTGGGSSGGPTPMLPALSDKGKLSWSRNTDRASDMPWQPQPYL